MRKFRSDISPELQAMLTSKAGSVIVSERGKLSEDAHLDKVFAFKRTARVKGVVTVHKQMRDGTIHITLLNDATTPLTDAEREQLHGKQEATLLEWARKRKTPALVVQPDEPLIERLPPQDHKRAAARGDRVAATHVETGRVTPAPELDAPPVAPPVMQLRKPESDEAEKLYREAFVTSMQTNPMGSHDVRHEAARAAVNSFREFFGYA